SDQASAVLSGDHATDVWSMIEISGIGSDRATVSYVSASQTRKRSSLPTPAIIVPSGERPSAIPSISARRISPEETGDADGVWARNAPGRATPVAVATRNERVRVLRFTTQSLSVRAAMTTMVSRAG